MEVPMSLAYLVGVVAAIVQVLRPLKIPGDYLPFISVGISTVLVAISGVRALDQLVMGGIMIGLAASGSASAIKGMGKLSPK